MKKSFLGFVCTVVFAAIVILPACGKEQTLPEPAVDLPVALSSFDGVKFNYDFELGDYEHDFELSKTQQVDFQMLLQADKWFDPGELPGRGYTSILDADNSMGWNLTVGYWDEENTIIALSCDNQTEKVFYFAPFTVQENAKEFCEKLK
ncbi:hypothetical protein ACS3UN_07830 [Oscillospiraceae bacterium LTW-04]|nr:hypothetical protein RBH76_02515 [Oscillospiraceae bacterium MB24-C1]